MEKSIRVIIQNKVNVIFAIDTILIVSILIINLYLRSVKIVHVATEGDVQRIETIKKYSEVFPVISLVSIGILVVMVLLTLMYIKVIIENLLDEFDQLTSSIIADEEFLNIELIEYSEFREVATKWNDKLMRIESFHKNRELYFNTIIHDLKFPLQSLKSNCNIYEKKWGFNRQIKKIKETTDSLEWDINRFLILDKIEYFDIPNIERRDFITDLNQIISGISDVQIKIKVFNESNLLQLFLSYDLNFLNKIMANLIENVYKYSEDNTLDIHIYNNQIVLANPCNKEINNIFGSARFKEATGTGLGSQIIKKYIDILKWDISSKTEDMKFLVTIKFEVGDSSEE